MPDASPLGRAASIARTAALSSVNGSIKLLTVAARKIVSKGPPPAHLMGWVDRPFPAEQFARSIGVEGWAIGSDGRWARVRVSIGGVEVCDLVADAPRPDVADLHRLVPNAERSGFYTVAHRPPLDDGVSHEMVVEAYDPLGELPSVVIGRLELNWVPTDQLPNTRGEYRKTWDVVADSLDGARTAVAGYTDDDEWQRTGEASSAMLQRLCAIGPTDRVLEIGCGAGRIGAHLAQKCAHWTGGDVSAHMVDFAREALAGVPNASVVQLRGSDLSGFGDASLDVVYSTVVFMHLDEWDRFRYVREMFRVLRPGGRIYIDNYNLMSDAGWAFFEDLCAMDPDVRPPNISKSSTPQELQRFLAKAGFESARTHPHGLFVAATGRKPFG